MTQPDAIPTAAALATLDDRALAQQTARINDDYTEAVRAHTIASQALGALLTEQIARRVTAVYPAAARLLVRGAAEYHTDADTGETLPGCPGHEPRLVPCQVLAADGTMLGLLDDLDPVCYWLERLTPLMGMEDAVLALSTRTWAFGRVAEGLSTHDLP